MVEGSGFDPSEVGFEFGERHLYRVEIGGVGGQEQEPASGCFQGFGRFGAFVGGQVVENDHGSGFKGRGELGLDVGVEGAAVHGTFDDPGCDEVGAGQAGDEGLGLPFAERGGAEQSLAHRTAAPQARHVGLY